MLLDEGSEVRWKTHFEKSESIFLPFTKTSLLLFFKQELDYMLNKERHKSEQEFSFWRETWSPWEGEARHSQIPISPCALWGMSSIWMKTKSWFHWGFLQSPRWVSFLSITLWYLPSWSLKFHLSSRNHTSIQQCRTLQTDPNTGLSVGDKPSSLFSPTMSKEEVLASRIMKGPWISK